VRYILVRESEHPISGEIREYYFRTCPYSSWSQDSNAATIYNRFSNTREIREGYENVHILVCDMDFEIEELANL